jgi:hypothetical protein
MDGQFFQVHVHGEAKEQAEHANENADHQQVVTVDAVAKEINVSEVWKNEISFTAAVGLGEDRRGAECGTGKGNGQRYQGAPNTSEN